MALDNGLTPGALFYYQAIEGAARAGAGTAAIWDAIRSTQEAAGAQAPRLSAVEVSVMRGMAGRNIASQARFDAAEGHNMLDGGMIGLAPWARNASERNGFPMWQVNFTHHTTSEEGPQVNTRVVTFSGQLPQTVEDFLAALEQDAQQLAEDYGETHVGIGDINIYAV